MPIYEYQCQQCGDIFSHLWRSIAAASESDALLCPNCGSESTKRIVSQVVVLGEMGGLTPGEQSAENAQFEKMASITPKEQINKLQAGKKKGQGK
jgi:putative FmdB family regulatory protein